MDRLERRPEPVDVMQAVLNAHQMSMWTAMPAIVKAYRASKNVVDVQIAIQMQIKLPDQAGTKQWIKIALVPDVPVFFPSGGGFTCTFPIAAGDECLVVFASRCISAWYQNGGEDNQQEEFRMHDLSDGFAFVGFRSLPRTLSPAPSATDVELRSDNGATKIAIKQDGSILLKSPVNVTLDTPTTHMTGNLQVDGDIHANGDINSDGTVTGAVDVIAGEHSISGKSHVHHIAGAGDTDPPKF